MTSGQQIPLGTRIPDSLHAVSVSIPTMEHVIGYEEGDPKILAQLTSGYPRFVVHQCLLEIQEYWQILFDKPGDPVWLTSSEKMARDLEAHLDHPACKFQKHGGVSGLRLPNDAALNIKAKRFLQHTGGQLSSRQAEDYLIAQNIRTERWEESGVDCYATQKLHDYLSPLFGVSDPSKVVLSSSGMNAFYAAFRAINEIQLPKGRNSWIQLGWLYTDTMHILGKLSPEGNANKSLYDVFDLDRLENVLAKAPDKFAGIITEAPTNPLIQTADLDRIRKLATKYDLYLVIDPTCHSPANIDISPYSDITVNSLTKYAANEGDVILGAAAVLDRCPDSDLILEKIRKHVETPYERDTSRLAAQIDNYLPLIEASNRNAIQIIEFLEKHPAIDKVFHAREARSKTNYEKIARSDDAIGGLIAFTLKDRMADFHDRLSLAKGPSFGISKTLASPFIYLAHYDLVSSDTGPDELARCGIPIDLIRFSIGSEPIDQILGPLEAALDS